MAHSKLTVCLRCSYIFCFIWCNTWCRYPKDVYSVTVDANDQKLVIRTSNKKYVICCALHFYESQKNPWSPARYDTLHLTRTRTRELSPQVYAHTHSRTLIWSCDLFKFWKSTKFFRLILALILPLQNLRYYKKFSVPVLTRLKLPLDEKSISFEHANNTLVINVCKIPTLCILVAFWKLLFVQQSYNVWCVFATTYIKCTRIL